MKKIIMILISAIMAFGCEKTVGFDSHEGDIVEVSLSLIGDITVNDSSLDQTRAGDTESNDLIGIQVYEGSSPYAYGLFDNLAGKSIYLHSDKAYKFKCTKITDGKTMCAKITIPGTVQSSSGYVLYAGEQYWRRTFDNSPHLSGYGHPFALGTINNLVLSSMDNKFYYNNSYSYYDLSSGNVANAFSNDRVYYPKFYRYYGEVSNYKPSAKGTVNINMKHTGFGLKYVVQGVTDGSASITIKNDKRTFFTKSDISSSFTSDGLFFQFEDVKSAWQYADDYSENVTVSMSWLRGVGVNQDLGSQVVQVKRNRLNVITVSLSTSTRSDSIDKPNVKITVDSI